MKQGIYTTPEFGGSNSIDFADPKSAILIEVRCAATNCNIANAGNKDNAGRCNLRVGNITILPDRVLALPGSIRQHLLYMHLQRYD